MNRVVAGLSMLIRCADHGALNRALSPRPEAGESIDERIIDPLS